MRPSLARRAKSSKSSLLSAAILPILLLIALGARLFRLGQANLWWDEALAIWAVRKGLVGVTLWTAGDVHPPLYFWSLWAWVRLFGESAFAMRTLSALFGVLTVAAVYAIGRLVGGRRVGWWAAGLTALARFHIWWSQEMRMYVLAGLCGALALYSFLRWLRADEAAPSGDQSARKWLVLNTLANVASLYTIFLSAVFVVAQNLAMLLALLWAAKERRWRLAQRWVLAQLVVLAFLGVWLSVSWSRMPTWSSAGTMGKLQYVQLVLTLMATGISTYVDRYVPLAVVPWLLTLLGLTLLLSRWLRIPREHRHELLAVLLLVLVVLGAALAIYTATLPRSLFYTPRIEARYFMPFAPAFWLLLAWSLEALRQRWRLVGMVSTALVAVLWLGVLPGYYQQRFQHDTLQSLSRAIISQAQPGDAVLLDSGSRYPMFLYDYERLAPGTWRPPMETISRSEANLDREDVEGPLTELAKRYGRIWLAEVDFSISDPDRLVLAWLREHDQLCLETPYGFNTLYLFDQTGQAPTWRLGDYTPEQPLDLTLADGAHLLGWELPVREVSPNDGLPVALLWETGSSSSLMLSLRTPQGLVVRRQRLAETTSGIAQRQQVTLPLGPDVARGRYELVLEPAAGEDIPLGWVRVRSQEPWPQPESLMGEQVSRFGQELLLQGYAVHLPGGQRTLRPGDELAVDLYWEGQGPTDAPLTVFAHVLGQVHNPRTQGPVWASHDAYPASGTAPTNTWQPGDVLVDRHILTLDEAAPAGEYSIEVGLYDGTTGQRVVVTDAAGMDLGDHLVLPVTLIVRP